MYREPTGWERNQDSNQWFEAEEEINIQPDQNEETRIQKMRRRLGNSGTTLSTPTPELQGCQKEKNRARKGKLV